MTTYTSKTTGSDGLFYYTATEHDVWARLFDRQMAQLQDFACRSFLDGLQKLDFAASVVPQVREIDTRLKALTGAGVEPVAALIPQDQFSTLLSQRKFPVATFIRRPEHLDYIEEPDIFHEAFGHCPMLTDPAFCRFMERFGALALRLPDQDLPYLFRLFWFTVEFGLIREGNTLKAFGAGIMSSPSEVIHAGSNRAKTADFDLMTMFRTPYRIDIVQPLYFVIDSFQQLANSLEADIPGLIARARRAGDLPALFEDAA